MLSVHPTKTSTSDQDEDQSEHLVMPDKMSIHGTSRPMAISDTRLLRGARSLSISARVQRSDITERMGMSLQRHSPPMVACPGGSPPFPEVSLLKLFEVGPRSTLAVQQAGATCSKEAGVPCQRLAERFGIDRGVRKREVGVGGA